jgi:hypothetical protein
MHIICNTPGVYISLDNKYVFKHVISVDKTDAKFLNIFVYRDFYIASVPYVASVTTFLFLSIRAPPKFWWCSEHRCSEGQCVRWLFKIHRSHKYEFGSPSHSDDFIPDKLIWTRQLKFFGAKIIRIAHCLRKNVCGVMVQFVLQPAL